MSEKHTEDNYPRPLTEEEKQDLVRDMKESSAYMKRVLASKNANGSEFDPDEAEQVGAFVEDAISEEDVLEATVVDEEKLDNIKIYGLGDIVEPLPIPDKPNFVKK